jgi:hypothetical protein
MLQNMKLFFISNGRYIDYLSLTNATDRDRILKVTLKTFKINIGLLIISNKIININTKNLEYERTIIDTSECEHTKWQRTSDRFTDRYIAS